MPSQEEIIQYIRQKAAEKGIDPEAFLRIVEGESGFNPAAVGDRGQSFGLAQLYMGGGLGNVYEQQYGSRPDNPEDWKQHIDFMADQAVSGGQGWGPWHAAQRPDVNVGQYQGLPGQQKTQPGRRGRASEVAQGATPMFPTVTNAAAAKPAGIAGMFGMTPEEFQDAYNPRGGQTLGGKFTDWVDLTNPNQRASERPDTLLSAALQKSGLTGPEKKKAKLEEKLTEVNPMAPQSEEDQLKKRLAKKPVTLANMFMGQPAPATPTTVGDSLFKFLGFG